jgi:acetyl-CoA synthetase
MSYYEINTLEEYFKHYKNQSASQEKFWDKIASENFTWYQRDKVVVLIWLKPDKKFTEAKVNITKTVLTDILLKR